MICIEKKKKVNYNTHTHTINVVQIQIKPSSYQPVISFVKFKTVRGNMTYKTLLERGD